ncbi:hypothetical protein PGTUg99_026063 [Puccinia graminis f. sp. tritici]|uniref:Uncharacterized protein n=1 Tax=Puccinia graminis f. sp. tritici TaxID=56615 RepID=A0A5B0RXI8_PUCGR|nr:hypothetical protein PGTUg99_026063 [Puccinia graminis f. sp. tritici]
MQDNHSHITVIAFCTNSKNPEEDRLSVAIRTSTIQIILRSNAAELKNPLLLDATEHLSYLNRHLYKLSGHATPQPIRFIPMLESYLLLAPSTHPNSCKPILEGRKYLYLPNLRGFMETMSKYLAASSSQE